MEAMFAGVDTALVLALVEAAAVVASAVAGVLMAANKRMDLVGAYALACVNAFGGGTVRDLLLDNRPFYWIAHPWFFLAILAICIPLVYSVRMLALATAFHRRSVRVDAIGLALFTISGSGIALAHDAPLFVAVLMGVVTGTTGGVLRDVAVNELPDLFRPGSLYASASFAGALLFVGGLWADMGYSQAAVVGALVTIVLRLVSVRLGLAMPRPQWLAERDPGEP
jgi:uncharacterized membrane protein YeiH